MRSDILRVVTQQMDIIDFDPNALADITEGLTGSDLRLVLREAVLEALREDRTTLTQEDLRDAVTDFEERDNLKNLDMIEGDHDALVAGGDISGAGDSDSDAEAASDGGTTTTTTTPTTPTTITITPTTITITRTTTTADPVRVEKQFCAGVTDAVAGRFCGPRWRRRPLPVPDAVSGVDTPMRPIDVVDAPEVLVVQFEVPGGEVLFHVLATGRLRDDRDVLLREEPRQAHLGRRGVVLLGDVLDGGFVEYRALGERGVGHQPVVVLDGVLAEVLLLEERVALDLVGRDGRVEYLASLVDEGRREVREGDVAGFARVVGRVERRQDDLGVVVVRWPVDVQHVDGVDAEALQTAVDGVGGVLGSGGTSTWTVFVERKTSSRSTSASRIPWPTYSSFPYTCAVSICR